MKFKIKFNKRNISLILAYLVISLYIILGNCLTFNIGNRLPIKLAEIITLIICFVLIIIHKKDVLHVNKKDIKIIIWFMIATIPMFLYNYEIKNILYGMLYSIRIIATLFAVIILNVIQY